MSHWIRTRSVREINCFIHWIEIYPRAEVHTIRSKFGVQCLVTPTINVTFAECALCRSFVAPGMVATQGARKVTNYKNLHDSLCGKSRLFRLRRALFSRASEKTLS